MAKKRQDFELWQGNSATITFTVNTPAGVVKPLSGVTAALWKMQPLVGNTTASISKTLGAGITIPTPANGKVIVALSTSDTDSLSGLIEYYHELRLYDGTDTVTVATGTVTVHDSAHAP